MEGDEELLGRPRPPSRRRRIGYLLGAAVLASAVDTGVVTQQHGAHPSAQDTGTAPASPGPSLAHPPGHPAASRSYSAATSATGRSASWPLHTVR